MTPVDDGGQTGGAPHTAAPTTVLVADDQDLVRAGLRALLASDGGLRVVGEARTGREAIALARAKRPDVVLMDLRMPDLTGVEATRSIAGDPSLAATRVLVLTTFDDDDDVFEAIRAGAAGYVLKDTAADELRRSIHTVAAGGSALDPDVARRVLHRLAGALPDRDAARQLDDLTEREIDVLRCVARGATNDEIGDALHISQATARTYVSRMLAKLGLRDRTELAIFAHRAGLDRGRG